MNTEPLRDLAEQWRADADLLRHRGAPQQAEALESAADDLEEGLRDWWLQPLQVSDASDESGYSPDHLYDLVADGRIQNAGRKGAPRIRRCDLPQKPGGGPELIPHDGGGGDFADELLRSREAS